MTVFRAKPLPLEAHRVRYQDLYSESADLPDWMQEAVDSGELSVVSGKTEGMVLTAPDGQTVHARLGKWVARTPAGRLLILDDETLADEYELVG